MAEHSHDNSLHISTEYDHLLNELETSDSSSVGLVLKAIYDGDEHHRFLERLDARIRNHDRDIEKMCNYHYQGFIDSIRELLQVRTLSQKLQKEIKVVDQELKQAGEKLASRAEELVRNRRVQANIALALEALSVCQPVLQLYAKLLKQMDEKRYYPALKSLEQLEHTYLPRVARYRFALSMHATIPQLRARIQEASMSELRDFLESIRKVSGKIGAVAMKHVSEQLNIEASLLRRKKIKRLDTSFQDLSSFEIDLNSIDEECSAQELVDFSPVYRCLHIYSVLGIREEFESYYRQQRLQQARLASQAPANMHESVDNYEKYFCVIVGFLVVEGHILNTANGLVSRAYLDDIWESIVNNIVSSLRTSMCHGKNDSDLILRVKRLILLFSATLRSYGYPVGPLFDLLLEVKDTYLGILFKQWGEVFSQIFDQDPFHPMQVETPEEYAVITEMFPFSDPELEKLPFPKKMPFSQFVPKVFIEVKEFILACLRFAEELNLSQSEMEDMVRKSANQLLTKTLGESLSNLIKKPNLGLFQLIQINLNMNYLEESSEHLEEVIAEHIGISSTEGNLLKVPSQSLFKDARADAEHQIFQQLNKKIDDFFTLANYDWLMTEPNGQASSYLRDLISFLRSTFDSFNTLPKKMSQTAVVSACQHIAHCLLRLLLDEGGSRQISFGALQQISFDVLQCEMFAGTELASAVGHSEDLALCFAQLRQLLDLFIHWDWSNFFKDYGLESSRYPRVNPQSAIIILEKIKEAEKKKNIFASLKKNERDKKKLVDTVIKQLRQLVTNGS